jgi:hypothetical protein
MHHTPHASLTPRTPLTPPPAHRAPRTPHSPPPQLYAFICGPTYRYLRVAALQLRRKEAEKLPDFQKVDCVSVSFAPFKAAVEDQLQVRTLLPPR